MGKKVEKLTPHTDGKKRKMVMTKLTAVALTARGANPEAHVTFFKSHKSETSVEKRTVLASIEAMHTHAVVVDDWAKINKGGSTSWAGRDGEQHTHDYVINEDGSIEIGANEGHLHFVEKNVEQITKSGLSDEQIADSGLALTFKKDESTANKGGKLSGNEDNTMTDAEKAAEKAEKALALIKKQLALAVLMGTMSDAQKTFHAKLDTEAQAAFLAKSVDEREAEVQAVIELAKAADAEVYKSADGTIFTKKDDVRLVAMAKQMDIDSAKFAKAQQALADTAVTKRASDLFKHMTGDITAHTALLKAVDTIEDAEVQKQVMEILAKSDAGIAALSTEQGHQHVDTVDKTDSAAANAKLESLALKYAEDNPGTNAADAYMKVSETPAGMKLYEIAVG